MKTPFGLYLILTDPVAGYEACAQAAVDHSVRFLQLRMKDADRNEILDTACRLRQLTHGTATHLILNDDLSIAIESDADGIHLGQDDLPLPEARTRWNHPGKLVGLSTHSLEQAQSAEALQPDYIGVGPVFSTPTKKDAGPALGIAETGRIIQHVTVPAVAIGGVNEHNLPALLHAGVRNYCVVRAVNQSRHPAMAIKHLQKTWKSLVF